MHPVNPTRSTGFLLLILYALAKLYLLSGVELGKDEAVYWYWGQHLDATYALLPFAALRLAHALLPYQAWFLRLVWIGASILAVLLLYRLCRREGLDPTVARWAAAIFATSHWIWHTGSYLHPDIFLVACWLLALILARRTEGRTDPLPYLQLGAALGLAVLCKYSGAFLAVALFLWILLTRPHPLRWRLLLWTLIPSLLVASPLIHAQIATRFYLPFTLGTLSRIAEDSPLLLRLLHFLTNPLLFVGPLLLYLLYRALAKSLVDLRSTLTGERLLPLLTALVPLSAFAFFALYRGQIKGNWILPALLGLWPFAFSGRVLPGRSRPFLILTFAVGLLYSLTVGLNLKHPHLTDLLIHRIGGSRLDATYVGFVSQPDRPREPTYSWRERLCEYHGWSGLAADLDTLLADRRIPLSTPLASTQYSVPFALSYYGRAARAYYTVADPRFRFLSDFHRQTGADRPDTLLFAARDNSPLPGSLSALYPKHQLFGEILRRTDECAPIPYQFFLFTR